METVRPQINSLLTMEQLNQLNNAVLDLLEHTGFYFPYPELKKKLSVFKQVMIKDGRLCFNPGFINEVIQQQRKSSKSIKKHDAIFLSVGTHAHHIVDMETDEIRPITTDDLVSMTKLVDSLEQYHVYGGAPGVPCDVQPVLRPFVQYLVSCEYSRYGRNYTGIPPKNLVKYLFEMKKIMDEPFYAGIHIVSPMKIEGNEFELFLYLVDKKFPLASVSITSMPMMGVTAPIFPAGAFIQASAEAIGTAALVKLIAPEIPVVFTINIYAFDMKYATMVHGSPEHNLIDLLQMEINKFYGIERGGRFIRTMAKRPKIQAAIEMSASAIIGAIAGAPVFSGAGLISLDEVFSPEQLVLSIDVRDYAQRVRDGFIFSPDTFSTGTIKKVVEQSEDFLLQPETIENYRKIYWQPMFLERTMLAQSTEQKN